MKLKEKRVLALNEFMHDRRVYGHPNQSGGYHSSNSSFLHPNSESNHPYGRMGNRTIPPTPMGYGSHMRG